MSLIDRIDVFWGFCRDKKEGKGEDSWCYSINELAAIMSVFDGCGGAGATVYREISNHTGAYLASRAVADATIRWFDKLCAGEKLTVKDLAEHYKSHLELCNDVADQPASKLKSKMMRDFPTTVAMWLVVENGDEIRATSISAGDSRTFLLDQRGLMQISRDDLRNEDAMSDIYNNASMTNVVSISQSFTLSAVSRTLDAPGILLSATDGCFGYFKSPMEFEYMLLDCLMGADSVDAWDAAVRARIGDVAGDDQALAVMVLGYGSFEAIKAALQPRYTQLVPVMKYMGNDVKRHWAVWKEYKHDYYRLAEGGVPGNG